MLPSLKNGEWLDWITQLVEESGGICAPADLPRSSFYCRLAAQPDHLVPQWYFSHAPTSHSPESETLFLNPTFFLNDGFSLLDSQPALFKNSFQPRIACIVHPATKALQPFWLEAGIASALESVTPGDAVQLPIAPAVLNTLTAAGILVPPNYAESICARWNHTISRAAAEFRDKDHVPVAGLIHPFHLSALRRYYRNLIRTGRVRLGDNQSSQRYAAHNDPIARFFHHQLTSIVSRIVDQPVKPSYVYMASYRGGARLNKHVDREQCEFSISLCLDYSPEPPLATPWPLRLQTSDATITVFQAIGDALLYRGRMLPHYRDELPPHHSSTSMFFHYVREDFTGPLD